MAFVASIETYKSELASVLTELHTQLTQPAPVAESKKADGQDAKSVDAAKPADDSKSVRTFPKQSSKSIW
jgi:hypothetical protein